jgi:hypothetical protein
VGLVAQVVDLAGGGGLVAAAGEPAVLVAQDHRAADRGRDVPRYPDVQRQAGPSPPPAPPPAEAAARAAAHCARTRTDHSSISAELPSISIRSASDTCTRALTGWPARSGSRPAASSRRIRSREASDPDWFLDAATHTAEALEQAQVEDHLVDNENRSPAVVAGEVLVRVGWLHRAGGQ